MWLWVEVEVEDHPQLELKNDIKLKMYKNNKPFTASQSQMFYSIHTKSTQSLETGEFSVILCHSVYLDMGFVTLLQKIDVSAKLRCLGTKFIFSLVNLVSYSTEPR